MMNFEYPSLERYGLLRARTSKDQAGRTRVLDRVLSTEKVTGSSKWKAPRLKWCILEGKQKKGRNFVSWAHMSDTAGNTDWLSRSCLETLKLLV